MALEVLLIDHLFNNYDYILMYCWWNLLIFSKKKKIFRPENDNQTDIIYYKVSITANFIR